MLQGASPFLNHAGSYPLICSPILAEMTTLYSQLQPMKVADTEVLYGLLPITPNPTHKLRALPSLNSLINQAAPWIRQRKSLRQTYPAISLKFHLYSN